MNRTVILNFVKDRQWCESLSEVGVIDLTQDKKNGFENILSLNNVGYLLAFLKDAIKGVTDDKIIGIVLPEKFYGKRYISKMLWPEKIEVMTPSRVEFLSIKEKLKEYKHES